jgi:EpsI family protein
VIVRACVLALLVLCAGGWARTNRHREIFPSVPLSSFPMQLDQWRGFNGPELAPDVARVLGADDSMNRVYRRSDGATVGLWVAFYASQRQGDAIHSPLNCLPGTGWTSLQHTRPVLDVNGASLPINRYLIQKRGERQLVMYWFQGRGRVVASEYANKGYLLVDALRQRRTDGALVRVTAPVDGDERAVERGAVDFIAALQPQLARWLP